MTEYASAPIPVSTNKSLISLSLQGVLFKKYSLSPFRYTRRPISISLYSMGSLPLLLWTIKDTSQTLNGLKSADPLKITSSILELRSTLDFCSPKTQRMASTILVLPQPLGPTTVVIPFPSFKETLLAKDLKPCILSSDIYINLLAIKY